MELRNINTFLHVAEMHSFSRAARELDYSQSAVSSQIAQLEEELGVPLFDRVGKTVRLTDAGQTFLHYARTLLTTAQQAKAALQPAPEARGTLRVAIADSLCSALMPGVLARFHALCPRVEVSFRSGSTQEMQDMLAANRADLAYTFDQPVTSPAFVRLLDEPEPCCFLAPAGHPLAGRQGLTLADLAGQEFLLTERGMSYREALEQLLAARQLTLRPYLELGDAALLCRLVEDGMGLTFLPQYIMDACLTGRAVPLEVADCRIEMRRQLFCHKEKWITPQMRVFIRLCGGAG
ncbi:MAG TPA: LysR family transcriptional regulator [Candidatus Faecalibacterium faecipullorum]|uniref:LysR family transcriptional regulator n=1 Tax=Candidatus Faecalibacterium faecipullorum TaxID=2838578 RepID=A0A9D2MEX3_9FIRM|nr:LysR family transcriptional regulator [Candidatus Faecalibacterium faecipullorum]